MTYAEDGVATQVDSPVLEIRDKDESEGNLLLRCDADSYISQTTPGVLEFNVPAEITQAIPPGTYWYDMFGTVDGVRLELAPIDEVHVKASVSLP